MTQEEKELLLKDLGARISYEVKVKTPYGDATLIGLTKRKGFKKDEYYIDAITDKQTYPIKYIKPYLRPMSSMTKDEKEELVDFGLAYWDNGKHTDEDGNTIIYGGKKFQLLPDIETYDWLNKKMFDYRGLIEKGLALEAPEGMYNLKEK